MHREQDKLFDPDSEFFIIQSGGGMHSIEAAASKLYGYCVSGGGIITDASGPEQKAGLSPDGAYISVRKQSDEIRITQDFIGAYGLYLYEKGDYWAISNSFLYLADYLKTRQKISFNKKYADHFLVSGLTTQSYAETMINEIRLLDRAAVVRISIPDRKLHISLLDYQENALDPDSPEGMAALDRWYEKWTALIRNLRKETGNITVDLSGGYDSRVVFGLFAGSGIDLNSVCVFSAKDDLYTHDEDFQIADSIAEHYGFKLNNETYLDKGARCFTPEEALNISLYLKLGFHKQMYWKCSRREALRYVFRGAGLIRNLSLPGWRHKDTLVQKTGNDGMQYGVEAGRAAQSILQDSFASIEQKFAYLGRTIPYDDSGYYFYRETRSRAHYGKAMVEWFFSNEFQLNPLLDSDLHKIKLYAEGCPDRDLLLSVIYDRYNPELLDFKVEGGRSLPTETVSYARMLNRKYPVNRELRHGSTAAWPVSERGTENNDVRPAAESTPPVHADMLNGILKDAFFSREVKKAFEVLYPSRVYDKMAKYWDKVSYHPEEKILTALSIVRFSRDCGISDALQSEASAGAYIIACAKHTPAETSEKADRAQSEYARRRFTIRMDLQILGREGNAVFVQELSDPDGSVQFPKRLNGGCSVCSDRGVLDAKIRCAEAGKLLLRLRSESLQDEEGENVPNRLKILRFSVNDADEITSGEVIGGKTRYRYTKKTAEGECIRLHLEWCPFHKNSGSDPANEH